jgi:hypothetical protein
MAHDRMEMFREAGSDVGSVEGLDSAARRRVGKALVDVEHGTWVVKVTVTSPGPGVWIISASRQAT